MKLKLLYALVMAAVAMAADKLKPVVITFPKDTPSSVIGDAKKDITESVWLLLPLHCLLTSQIHGLAMFFLVLLTPFLCS